MLKIEIPRCHKVRQGQTIKNIAAAYCVGERALVESNGLKGEVGEGQILVIPAYRGNAYTVRAGDTKQLLCGSVKRYEENNGKSLYPGKRVVL